ncbi:SRPBCC family protein [Kaistella pullorum]|uniref:SRPBCC family protein n=1 Tax=Kaistella pullorum TaxID=2763074 RepID=A0ABR8WQS0_9FLAO|nr:SRPBCC family protein [Kaistella pullorum]MBD8019076.1 SRPBCC family protein [Kaistella pullorum]
MTEIKLQTEISADIERCFDLARDVDAHKLSTSKTKEIAVAGRTSGLCEKGDKITWEAVHFGIKQRLSVEIVEMQRPIFFEDKMTKGAFKSMNHKHNFKEANGKTIMSDHFQYEVPFGLIGSFFDKLILRNYMIKFLKTRNQVLKSIAEKEPASNIA